LRALLAKRVRLVGPQGFTMMAAAAIGAAAWDLGARRAGQPLCVFLGGAPRATPGYAPVGMSGAAGAVRECAAGVAAGPGAAKAKIGYARVDEDRAVGEAMRQVLGRDRAWMVDDNQSLSIDEAIHEAAVARFEVA
jgi:mandelate racemase